MVVVAAGSSVRFGGDKLTEEIAGAPLVAHAVKAVRDLVDVCILVGRAEQLDHLRELGLGVEVVVGGPTRTSSEMAGLAALGKPADLIGIHDAARPLVSKSLIEALFETADRVGGAVPVLAPDTVLLEREGLQPVPDLMTAQTPQVFRGPDLMAAYVRASQAGFDGRDTAEIMERFAEVAVAAVPGDPGNIKVTYPTDLEEMRRRLTAPSHNGPR
jgi:2-C-methyl-D-erythritol 4-phosphate cytidylyltransferase